jgi:hypothetical protein
MKSITFPFLICGSSVIANVKLTADIDTDRIMKYGLTDYTQQEQSDLQEAAGAVIEFNNLALQYSHEVQAESREALAPLADNLKIMSDYLSPDESCDAEQFASCLADTWRGDALIIYPRAFRGRCAEDSGCVSPFFNNMTREE